MIPAFRSRLVNTTACKRPQLVWWTMCQLEALFSGVSQARSGSLDQLGSSR